jgi:uncharacterized protein (DUF736 family)
MADYKGVPGKGALFTNDNPKTEKSPKWKGTIVADEDIKAGQTIKLAAWEKVAKNGNVFISLSIDNFKPGEGNVIYPKEEKRKASFDDEVPF